MLFFQVRLVQVRMCVLGSVAVRMRVFVLEVFVVVAGVRMRVSEVVVLVFVGVRRVMTTLMVCHCHLQSWEILMDPLCSRQRPDGDGFAPVPHRA